MSWKKRRQMRYGEPNIPFVRWLNLFFLISLLTTFFGYPSVWFLLSLVTTPWLFFMCIPYMGNGFPLIFDKLVRWIFFKIKGLINKKRGKAAPYSYIASYFNWFTCRY